MEKRSAAQYRDRITERIESLKYSELRFTKAEIAQLAGWLPKAPSPSIRTFLDRVASHISAERMLGSLSAPLRNRRQFAKRIAAKAHELHGLIGSAPFDVASYVQHLTEVYVATSIVGVSLVGNDRAIHLLLVLDALERAASQYNDGVPNDYADDTLRIGRVGFEYQAAFSLRPSHNKNSAFLRALEGLNLVLAARGLPTYPVSANTVKKAIAHLQNSGLPTATRGRRSSR